MMSADELSGVVPLKSIDEVLKELDERGGGVIGEFQWQTDYR
jgi:hypothetical protein